MISAKPTVEEIKSAAPTTESMISAKSIVEVTKSVVSTTAPMISTKPTTTIPATSSKSDTKRIALSKLNSIKDMDKISIEEFFSISDTISRPTFINAILVGKKNLFIREILAAKIEGNAIYGDLSTISKENLTKLLEKVRQLKNQYTVCCLLFDLSSVSTTVNHSACFFYGCENPLQSVCVGVSSNDQIKRIKDVIRELSSILPVIVFPLFPAAAYIMDSTTRKIHQMAHKSLNTCTNNEIENFFVKDDKSDNSIEGVDTIWNEILRNQHENNVCYPFMLKYLNRFTTFICKSTDFDVLQGRHFSKKMTWMAFICIVLQSYICSGKITVYSTTPAPESNSSSDKSEYILYFNLLIYVLFRFHAC